MNLDGLQRFENKRTALTKLESTRPNSSVDTGRVKIGDFSFYKLADNSVCVLVGDLYSLGNYLRTSPVVKIIDMTEKSTTFQTEGGIYKVEYVYSGVDTNG